MNTSSFLKEDSAAGKLINWILDAGIKGLGVLPPASQVAANHFNECERDVEKAIDSVIGWRTAHAAGTGFVTGLGGLATLPLAIPASLASSYALGANTIGAIADLRGHDTGSDTVRTLILLALIGETAGDILKQSGIAVGNQIGKQLIQQVPGKVLIEINKKVGFRLITKAGEKGAINLMKLVPIAGGVVGAAFDATFIQTCGRTAKSFF